MLIQILSRRNIINTLLAITLAVAILYFKLQDLSTGYLVIIILLLLPALLLSQPVMAWLDIPLGKENLPVYLALLFTFFSLPSTSKADGILYSIIISYLLFFTLVKLNNNKDISVITYLNLSLFAAAVGYIYPPVLIFALFLLLSAFFTSTPGKKVIIIILGYLTVFYIATVAEIVITHKKLAIVLARFQSIHIHGINPHYLPQWAFLAFLTIISLFFYLSRKNKLTLKNRKLFWLILLFMLTAFLANFFISPAPIFPLIYGISILTAYFFHQVRLKNYLKDIFFIAIVIFGLLLGFNLI